MSIIISAKLIAKQVLTLVLVSLILHANPAPSFAQWQEDEFVLGGWLGPRVGGSSATAHESKLQEAVDAGINLLVAAPSGEPRGYDEYQTSLPNDPDIVYQLSGIARVNQNNGRIVLRRLIEDVRYHGLNVTTLPVDLDDYTVRLTTPQ